MTATECNTQNKKQQKKHKNKHRKYKYITFWQTIYINKATRRRIYIKYVYMNRKKRSLVVLKLLKSSLIPPKQKETFWVTDKNQQFINTKKNKHTNTLPNGGQSAARKTQIHRRTTYNIRVRRTFFYFGEEHRL